MNDKNLINKIEFNNYRLGDGAPFNIDDKNINLILNENNSFFARKLSFKNSVNIRAWLEEKILKKEKTLYFFISKKYKLNRSINDHRIGKLTDISIVSPKIINRFSIKYNFPFIYCYNMNFEDVLFSLHNKKTADIILNSPFCYMAQLSTADFWCYSKTETLKTLINTSINDVNPVFIVSPGRVGSTLLNKILNEIGLKSLSEPDVLSNSFLKYKYEQGDLNYKTQFLNTLKFTINSFQLITNTLQFGIKLRGQNSPLVDLFYELWPNAKFIFIFRNIENWAKSTLRAFPNRTYKDLVWLIEKCLEMLKFLKLNRATIFILSYDKLKEYPIYALKDLCTFLEIKKNMESFLTFDKDSQEGSSLSREVLKSREYNQMEYNKFIDYWKNRDKKDLRSLDIEEIFY